MIRGKILQVLSDRWRSLITRCCGAFPGMPPEVVSRAKKGEAMGTERGEDRGKVIWDLTG